MPRLPPAAKSLQKAKMSQVLPETLAAHFEAGVARVFCNPRHPHHQQVSEKLLTIGLQILGCQELFWFATSGSTAPGNAHKWVALTREALLISAAAVNIHLKVSLSDVWVSALPLFHVGGFGIYARAYVAGCRLYDLGRDAAWRWAPAPFVAALEAWGATCTSLVPAQVRDIVMGGFKAPMSLRAAVVGGGALAPRLYAAAHALGWPLLPSYGLTECASQVATAQRRQSDGAFPPLVLLPHVDAKVTDDGRLQLSSGALFSAYGMLDIHTGKVTIERPFKEEEGRRWFTCPDRVHLDAATGTLAVLGRADAIVKVGGESVDVAALQALWEQCVDEVGLKGDSALFPQGDDRLGVVVAVAHTFEAESAVEATIALYNARVLPFERVRLKVAVPEIPRTALGKVSWAKLTQKNH